MLCNHVTFIQMAVQLRFGLLLCSLCPLRSVSHTATFPIIIRLEIIKVMLYKYAFSKYKSTLVTFQPKIAPLTHVFIYYIIFIISSLFCYACELLTVVKLSHIWM